MCKGCSIKIDKDAVRIGTTVPGPGDYDLTSWRHLACQKKKPASLAELNGFNSLKPADQDLVKAFFAGDMATVAAAKRKADEATAAAAAASTPKKPKPSPSAATPTTGGKAPAAAPSPAPSNLAAETAMRDDAQAVFGKMSIENLKNCLRTNEQLLGGAKGELVERCVDRKLFGNLPRCPKCSIGKLKVVYPRAFGHGGMGTFTVRHICPVSIGLVLSCVLSRPCVPRPFSLLAHPEVLTSSIVPLLPLAVPGWLR